MSYTSKGNSEVLVAGMQNTMFTVDVDRGQVTREVCETLSMRCGAYGNIDYDGR
jgi:hypothetical protein